MCLPELASFQHRQCGNRVALPGSRRHSLRAPSRLLVRRIVVCLPCFHSATRWNGEKEYITKTLLFPVPISLKAFGFQPLFPLPISLFPSQAKEHPCRVFKTVFDSPQE